MGRIVLRAVARIDGDAAHVDAALERHGSELPTYTPCANMLPLPLPTCYIAIYPLAHRCPF